MKPLKILLGNNTLSMLAGSETWTRTLALQLKKLGHTVEGFSPELGIISEELEKNGIPCFSTIHTSGIRPFSICLEEEHDFSYDVIISNHNHIVDFLRKRFPKTPIISTIHGVMHFGEEHGKKIIAPEHPSLEGNVSKCIAVSEEVQDKLMADYKIDSTIIRNFFDVSLFEAKRPISDRPKAFLINTSYADSSDEEVKVIREVAKHYEAKVIAIGQNFTMTADTMKAIENSDIVIGMGRSVLEGVCSGRLGIVHGRWGTGGVVCGETINELRLTNFSGRNSGGKMYTKEEFIEAIDRYYGPLTIQGGMEYVRTHHNVAFAAESFIQIARGLINQSEEAEKPVEVLRPYRRAKDVVQPS